MSLEKEKWIHQKEKWIHPFCCYHPTISISPRLMNHVIKKKPFHLSQMIIISNYECGKNMKVEIRYKKKLVS